MTKVEELETKIRAAVQQLLTLRKDNTRLRMEVVSLKGHVTLLTGENQKAQQILAEYNQLRRVQEQVANKVERALISLNNLRNGTPV